MPRPSGRRQNPSPPITSPTDLPRRRSRRRGMPAVAAVLTGFGVFLALSVYQSRGRAAERQATWPSADATVVRIDRKVETNSKNRSTTTVRSTVQFTTPDGRTCEGVLTDSGYGPSVRVFYDPGKVYDVTRTTTERHEVYSLRDLQEGQSPKTLWTGVGGIAMAGVGGTLLIYSMRGRRRDALPLEP